MCVFVIFKIFNFFFNIGVFVFFIIVGKMVFLIGILMIIVNFVGNYIGSKYVIYSNGEIIKKVLVIIVGLLMCILGYKVLFV